MSNFFKALSLSDNDLLCYVPGHSEYLHIVLLIYFKLIKNYWDFFTHRYTQIMLIQRDEEEWMLQIQ